MGKTDINDYREEVARFLRGFDSVEIHQFGQTILYIPIYLVIQDLKNECKLNNIKLVDSSSNDEVTVKSVKSKDNSFFTDETESKKLIIGLSELLPTENNHFHHFPIIERVPLWGLARQNNKKIKKIRGSKKQGDDNFNDYWELFGSKFSLLNKSDFEGLTVSLYPDGSTIYRIFTDFIEGTEGVLLAPHTMDEFDDLFSGTADVCLTVHPTYAIKRSQTEGTQLEVVYNHYGEPTAFTSLYMKKYAEEEEKNNIARLFMKYLEILVYDKIKHFYKSSYDDYLHNAEVYCHINKKDDDNKKDCIISKVIKDENECYKNKSCQLPSIIAQQIINDSRIYYHDLYASNTVEINALDCSVIDYLIDDYLRQAENVIANKTKTPQNFSHYESLGYTAKILDEIIEAHNDPIYYFSKLCNKLNALRHEQVTFNAKCLLANANKAHLNKLIQNNKLDLALFGYLCRLCNIELNNKTFSEINDKDFKITHGYLSTDFFKCSEHGKNQMGENLIYFDKSSFEQLFHHFKANNSSMRNSKDSYYIINHSDNLLILLIIIQYDWYDQSNKVNENMQFIKENSNSNKILSCWHYNCKHDNSPVNLLKIPKHGNVILEENYLKYNFIESSFQLDEVINEKNYWIFDFRLEPYHNSDRGCDGEG